MTSRAFVGCLIALCAVGCPSPAKETKYPPRPEGCDVKLFTDIPPMQTDNIGPVSATCDESVTDAACLRTLEDEACKLGADVIWGVADMPSKMAGKKKVFGRSAHTKAGGK